MNSDDPAYFGGYITDNLIAAQQGAALRAEDLLQLERNAFEIAWLPAAIRDGYLAEIAEYAATGAPGGP